MRGREGGERGWGDKIINGLALFTVRICFCFSFGCALFFLAGSSVW